LKLSSRILVGLVLTAGFVVLVGSVLIGRGIGEQYFGWMMGAYYGVTTGCNGFMRVYGFGGWLPALMTVGVISGGAIMAGAVILYSRPNNARAVGLVTLGFSLLSLFAMGGFVLGAALGILGGVLAFAGGPHSGTYLPSALQNRSR